MTDAKPSGLGLADKFIEKVERDIEESHRELRQVSVGSQIKKSSFRR